jgi:hypothetical protein
MILRDAIGERVRQSGFRAMLHNSCISLHVSLYNYHTAISISQAAGAPRRLDLLCFTIWSSRNMSSRDSALDDLQTEQTATQTLLNRATRPLAAPWR